MALSTPAYAQIIDEPEPITIEVTIEQEKEVAPEPVEKPMQKTSINREVACSCVAYARTIRPDIPYINASDISPNIDHPVDNGAVLFFYPNSGLYHIAIIDEVGTSTLKIKESNMKSCTISERVIPKNDIRIIGFYN